MLWGFLSLAAYLVSGRLLLRALHLPVWQGLALFVGSSVFWVPPLVATQWLNLQQLLLLLLVSVCLLQQRHQDTWAGVLLGVAGLLKIWPLVILVIPILQRRWRLVAATVGVVLVVGSVSLPTLRRSAPPTPGRDTSRGRCGKIDANDNRRSTTAENRSASSARGSPSAADKRAHRRRSGGSAAGVCHAVTEEVGTVGDSPTQRRRDRLGRSYSCRAV